MHNFDERKAFVSFDNMKLITFSLSLKLRPDWSIRLRISP